MSIFKRNILETTNRKTVNLVRYYGMSNFSAVLTIVFAQNIYYFIIMLK